MATQTPKIDLRLSRASIEDIKRFREEMEATQKRTAELAQDLKSLKSITDALKTKNIFTRQSSGGAGSYLSGTSFLQGLRVNEVQRLATTTGQVMENTRRTMGYARQGLKFYQDQADLAGALNLNLRTQARQLQKITSLEEAKTKLKQAEIRMGFEQHQGNLRAAQSAERIRDVLRERVKLLQEENRERERAARQAARPTDGMIADRSRSLTMQRLFGDGGASLFAIQAGLSANYMLLNQTRSAMSNAASFALDFDLALRNLQAITATTDGEMGNLKETLIGVSEATKFTAVEVANAAVTLGQAGLSTDEIEGSIEAVTLLATATGTDLPRAVDIATSVLGVFNMQSSQMADVANTMTEAVNSSKLNIEKLTLGLQYSGNIAAQSGVRFDELTAALGAMANAGIRSGSTLGTGMRQILIALQKPSGEFKETLERLGLSMRDVDLESQGLYGAMRNLSEAGFTAGDAIRSFEVRASAAYNALANNLDQMLDLESGFQNSTAAARANEIQMRSLRNQSARFGSVLGSVANEALEPMVYLLRDMLSGLSDLFSEIRQYDGVLRSLSSVVVGLGAAFVTWRLGALTAGLTRLIMGTERYTARTTAMSNAARRAAVGIQMQGAAFLGMERSMRSAARTAGTFSRAMSTLGGPLGLALTGLTVGALALSSWRAEQERLNDVLDEALTNFNESSGAMEETAVQIGNVEERIGELLNRYDLLKSDSRLLESEIRTIKNQFYELGLAMDDGETDVDNLITALKNLREELREEYVARVRVAVEGGEQALRLYGIQQRRQASTIQETLDANRSIPGYLAPGPVSQGFGGTGPAAYAAQANQQSRIALIDALEQATTGLDNENSTLDQARAAEVEIQRLLADVMETLEGQGEGPVRSELLAQQSILAEVLQETREVMQTIQDRDSLTSTLEDQRDDMRVAQEQLNPRVANVLDGADLLQRNAGGRIQDAIASQPSNDVRAQLEAARAEQEAIESERAIIQDELNYLLDQGLIGAENSQTIQQNLNKAQGDVLNELEEVAANAGEVEEQLQRNAVTAMRSRLEEMRGDLRSASSQDEIDTLFTQFNQLMEEYRAARIQQVMDTVENVDLQADALQEVENEIAGYIEAARDNRADVLEKIAEDAQTQQLEAAKAEQDAAQATYDRAVRLAEEAETLAERNRFLEEALAAARDVLAAGLRIIGIEMGDNPAAAAAATSELETEFADNQDEIEGVRGSKLGRGRPGGGGGGGREEDPVVKWAERATAQVEAILLQLDDDLLTAEQGLGGIESIFAEAEQKLGDVRSQMEALQSRLINGTLTASEQERLNTLVERHGHLTEIIEGNQERILELMIEQGRYGEVVGKVLENWSEQNLDMGKTALEGMRSFLDTVKSSMATLWSDWSTGAKSGKEAFRDFAASILQSVNRIFAEMLTVYLLQKAMGWLSGVSPQLGQLASAVLGMNEGGRVPGQMNRDSVPVMLRPDEYVLRSSAAQAIGYDKLDEINAMGNRTVAKSEHHGAANQNQAPTGGGEMNIYLLDQRSQAPSMGPQDVLAVISDDITRGGTTKRLIKSVNMGAI